MSSQTISKATADNTPDELVALAKQLGKDVFADRAAEYDRKAEFPTENYQDLHKAGLLALTIPAEYGGIGATYETYCRVSAELGRWCGATALTLNMHAQTMFWT
ncbi:MAG: acyl-CoA dehydrogenase family protein, partial [Rhizobiaceae bacterium]